MLQGEVGEMHHLASADDVDHGGRRWRATFVGLDRLILIMINDKNSIAVSLLIIFHSILIITIKQINLESSNSCRGPADHLERLSLVPTQIAGMRSAADIIGYRCCPLFLLSGFYLPMRRPPPLKARSASPPWSFLLFVVFCGSLEIHKIESGLLLWIPTYI